MSDDEKDTHGLLVAKAEYAVNGFVFAQEDDGNIKIDLQDREVLRISETTWSKMRRQTQDIRFLLTHALHPRVEVRPTMYVDQLRIRPDRANTRMYLTRLEDERVVSRARVPMPTFVAFLDALDRWGSQMVFRNTWGS